MAGLLNYEGLGAMGIAPYGLRYSGDTPKGKGYFGLLPQFEGGFSTEISGESTIDGKNVEYPLMVPSLTKEQLDYLLSGQEPSDDIYKNAEEYARQRISQGLSPFAGNNELRYPVPTGLLYLGQ
jgi:hypothetical protein